MTEVKLQVSLDDLESLIESDPKEAVEQLRQLLRSDPLSARAYRMLARALKADGGGPSGVSTAGVALQKAAGAIYADDLEAAEIILRPRLRERPDDSEALQLLAEFATRLGYNDEAEELLRLVLEIRPDSVGARMQLAAFLYKANRPDEAIRLVESVLSTDNGNLVALNLRAAALARAGRADEALLGYEQSLQINPNQARVWSWYGQVLRTLGRGQEAISALQHSVELSPDSGEFWWGLSDLKTYRFGQDDIDRMESALDQSKPESKDERHLHFALGKAYEDSAQYERAFMNYARGNELQKSTLDYDPSETTEYVELAAKTFSKQFFAERYDWGVDAPDPVFILGMPRSGSTLLEQILGRHPQIEATMELPEFLELGEQLAKDLRDFPPKVVRSSAEDMAGLGQRYLDRTRRYRKSSKPLFVDKMPNNWMYVPLIQLALPKAKIIDIRRNPLDCCLSNFKQMFLTRQGFSNDLDWLGRYYRDYVELMRVIDAALPGRVHRVIYERLVDDSETEIRRLLDYVGVEFDDTCLRPGDGSTLVRTTSAEQVRRPINREGIGSSKPYEPWLNPLVQALGPLLTEYER